MELDSKLTQRNFSIYHAHYLIKHQHLSVLSVWQLSPKALLKFHLANDFSDFPLFCGRFALTFLRLPIMSVHQLILLKSPYVLTGDRENFTPAEETSASSPQVPPLHPLVYKRPRLTLRSQSGSLRAQLNQVLTSHVTVFSFDLITHDPTILRCYLTRVK